MSHGNVKLVRSWFDRWNQGERFIAEELHPEVEIVTRFQPHPFRGHDGFRQWIREIDEQFAEWRLVVDDWRDAGTRVVALGQIHLRGQESSVEFDQPMGWLIEVRDEKLFRLEPFVEPAKALEAAGLPA